MENFRDRVDISLEKYDAMRDEIAGLIKHNADLSCQIDNLKGFLKDTYLPVDALADGKGKDIRLETQINPMDLSVKYILFVTVQDIDLYRHERARLYNKDLEGEL